METIWLGSQANYLDYQERQARLDAAMASGMAMPAMESGPGYSQHGSVAVVDVSGPLVNSDSMLNQIFGMTSYNSIRSKLVDAATNPDVSAIVMNMDSPGGSANGMADTAHLIRQVNGVKPVTAYVSGTMASAAYGLGAAAGKIFGGTMATVGSIGVTSTVMDHSKRLEKEGITPHVMRTGDKKALGGPNEPLTEEAKAHIEEHMYQLHELFVAQIAEHRGMSAEHVAKNLADGSEYIGQRAVQAGLMDGITTLDALCGWAPDSDRIQETLKKGLSHHG